GSISHSHLRSFLDRRVTDGVIRRMIDKWLKAGVLEDGLLRHATEGSPQGGVISPCLSNIFLHHVLDEWFENEVKPRLKGRSTLVRGCRQGGIFAAPTRDYPGLQFVCVVDFFAHPVEHRECRFTVKAEYFRYGLDGCTVIHG